MYIASVYLPPSCDKSFIEGFQICLLDTISDVYAADGQPVIVITGDINKLCISEFVALSGLKQIVQTPTRGDALLDVFFTNVPECYSAVVLARPMIISDHSALIVNPVKYQGCFRQFKECSFRDTRLPKKNLLVASISQHDWGDVFMEKNPNDQVTMLTAFIKTTFEVCCPEKYVRVYIYDPPWMTPMLKFLLNKRHRLICRNPQSIKLMNLNSVIEYRVAEAKQRFAENLPKFGTRKFWRTIKSINKPSGGFFNSDFSADQLNDHFAAISTDDAYQLPTRFSSCSFVKIDHQEVLNALMSLRKSAPGPSAVPFWVFKLCAHTLAPVLTACFQNCVANQCFPKFFKKAIITPIPKVANPKTLTDYRPISVTDILSRVFEKVILLRYINNVLCNTALNQHGFRQGRSTVTALIDLHGKIINALKTSKVLHLASIDLSKAFDRIRHSACVDNALRLGIDHALVNIISDFLTERVHAVSINGQLSSWRPINRGVGQGTVQGPIIFLIATAFITSGVPHVSYADDKTFVFSAPYNLDTINNNLLSLKEDYNKVGLDLNPSKTTIMRIGGTGQESGLVNTMKILGVQIESNLKVSQHVKNKCRLLTAGIFALRRFRFDLGFSIFTCDLLFRQLMLSKLLYCAEFWWPLLSKFDKTLIYRVIKKAHRIGVLLEDFSIEDVVLKRQLRLFKKLCKDESFSPYSPTIAYSGRRYLAPKILTERERKFFMNFMSFYCIKNDLLL